MKMNRMNVNPHSRLIWYHNIWSRHRMVLYWSQSFIKLSSKKINLRSLSSSHTLFYSLKSAQVFADRILEIPSLTFDKYDFMRGSVLCPEEGACLPTGTASRSNTISLLVDAAKSIRLRLSLKQGTPCLLASIWYCTCRAWSLNGALITNTCRNLYQSNSDFKGTVAYLGHANVFVLLMLENSMSFDRDVILISRSTRWYLVHTR